MARRSYRERTYLKDKSAREFKYREFTARNLAMHLKREYDAIVRHAPDWEIEIIVYATESYRHFELEGDAIPSWIHLSLTGADGEIVPEITRIVSFIGFHFICRYPKGATTALRRKSWLEITLNVDDEPDRKLSCRFRKWFRA
jgi:hypothetical protein